jgi:hypothetical protein
MADAGTVTVTEENQGSIKKIKFAWTSESGGTAVKTTPSYYTGQIIGFMCIPGTSGDAPTTLYDVTITNADATDILHGVGVDRPVPITDTGRIHPSLLLGSVVNTQLTLNVANAGNGKSGTVYLYIG